MAKLKGIASCVIGLLFFGQFQVLSQEKLAVPFDVQLCDQHTVMINWTRPAADRLDYILEKSKDEKVWEAVAYLNSQVSSCYDYIDLHATTGTVFYRVAQRNDWSLVAVSGTKWIKISKPDKLYLWPTPANNILHIRSPFVDGNLDIIDGDGRLVRKVTIIDSITNIPVQALPGGVYFVQARHGRDLLVEKFIKQNF